MRITQSILTKIISGCRLIGVCFAVLSGAPSGLAYTNYYVVPVNPAASPPFTNWATASTSIQDAVNLALNGDTIYLTNGHYYLTNEVQVNRSIVIRSFRDGLADPDGTIIDAYNFAGKPVTNRCFTVAANAVLIGFTLTNGVVIGTNTGGGCYMVGNGTPVLTNCVVAGNTAQLGGGVHNYAFYGVVTHCRIVNNSAGIWGGGIYLLGFYSVIKDSTVGWNTSSADGCGLAISSYSSVSAARCDIVSNSGHYAVGFIGAGAISNCVIRGTTNSMGAAIGPRSGSGFNNSVLDCRIVSNYCGGGYVSQNIRFRNCLVAGNRSDLYGGLRATISSGWVESCTVANNQGATYGGVWLSRSGSTSTICNAIISGNTGGTYNDLYTGQAGVTNGYYFSCCPTVELPPVQGNIMKDPSFAGGDCRLNQSSPCVNAGSNQAWMVSGRDLDGKYRIDKFSDITDMGCYEYLLRGIMFKVR